jgi:divalent metal cation (Fe/Co/Zn/Cd) transporter
MKSETLDLLIDTELNETKAKEWHHRVMGLAHLGLLALGWYWFGWWCVALLLASQVTVVIICRRDVRILLLRQRERLLERGRITD